MRHRRGWPRGVYGTASHALLPVSLVVIGELPQRRDTLLLRLMGSGRTLLRAVKQVRALADDAWERRPAAAAITVPRLRFETLDPPDQELAMEIRETYEQWEERVTRDARERAIREGRAEGMAQGLAQGMAQGMAQGLAQGKTEGATRGKADAVVRLLEKRFGPVEAALEARVHDADEATLDAILDRLLTAASARDAIG